MIAESLRWAATWFGALLLIGVLAFPLAHRLMPALPSRGLALSPALGVLLVSYIAWMAASVHLVPFGRRSAGAAVVLVALLSVASEIGARGAAVRWLRRNGRVVFLFALTLFVSFAIFAWVRGFDPDIRSTEKPMEIGFLTSTMRATWMPPHDPWLSGYGINYYYFGYVEAATLGLLAGVRAAVAFNLTNITLFALTFTGASGITYDVLRRQWTVGKRWSHKPTGRLPDFPTTDRRPPFWSCLLGGALVAVAGNLYGFLRLVQAPAQVWHAYFWTGIGWNSTRVIQDVMAPGVMAPMITEFPIFSFILGDNHPHVLALPVALLVIGIAYGWWLRPAARWQTAIPRYLLTALAVGALYPINSWDLPTYGLLVGLALLLRRPRQWRQHLLAFVGVIVAGFALFLPYLLHFTNLVGNRGDEPAFIARLSHVPGLGFIIRTFGVVVWQHTRLGEFLIVFAVPLVAAATLVIRGAIGGAPLLSPVHRRRLGSAALVVALVALITRTPMLLPVGAFILAGVVALLRPVARRPADDSPWAVWTPTDQAATALAIYGAALPIIPEFFFLRDAFDNRMNTMFKVDYQAWLLLMLAGAYGIVTLVAAMWAGVGSRGSGVGDERVAVSGQRSVVVGFRYAVGPTQHSALGGRAAVLAMGAALFACAALTFPVVVTYQRTGHFGDIGADFGGPGEGWQGLDGLRYVQTSNPDEYAAMQWLADHASPDDHLIEALGNSYGDVHGWFESRFSAATGVPGVLGWYYHELQWRAGTPAIIDQVLPQRARDIGAFYNTTNPSEARQIIATYDISWVIVGQNEREGYGQCTLPAGCPPYQAAGLAKFPDMLDIAYQHGSVTIYHVRRP